MSHIRSYSQYHFMTSGMMPRILYYDDSRNPKNEEILKIMEEMRNEYPFVLCYQVNWLERKTPNLKRIQRKPSEIVCYKNSKKIFTVSPYNSTELHNLFQSVYNDCVLNFKKHFKAILTTQKNIPKPIIFKLFNISKPSYPIYIDGKSYENYLKIFPIRNQHQKSDLVTSKEKCYQENNTNVTNEKQVLKMNMKLLPPPDVSSNISEDNENKYENTKSISSNTIISKNENKKTKNYIDLQQNNLYSRNDITDPINVRFDQIYKIMLSKKIIKKYINIKRSKFTKIGYKNFI